MAKRVVARFVTAAVACLAVASAHAATLEAIEGEVMINRGNGYRFVSGTVELNPGDMVIANSSGAAQLVYPDGCAVSVQPGGVITVAPQSPCATQTGNGSGTPSLGTLAFGALVVGGGIGAAVLLGQGSDKGASP